MEPLKLINSPKEQLFAPTMLIFLLLTTGNIALIAQNLKNSQDFYSQWLVATSIAFIMATFVVTYINIFQAWKKKRGFLLAFNVILAAVQLWLCLASADWLTRDSFPNNCFQYLLIASIAFNIQLFLGNLHNGLRYGLGVSVVLAVIFGVLFQKYLTQVQFLQVISLFPLVAYIGFFFYLVRQMVKL